MTEREAIANIEYARRWMGCESDFSEEALDMAIFALEKLEKDRWIPVTERLPEEPDEVLVTDGDGEIRHAVYCHVCKKDVFITYEESMTIHQVIAWRPLPEPYKEEEA
jgi:hypothetical protein